MPKSREQHIQVEAYEWKNTSCDKADLMAAAFCGAFAGMIDVVFVGVPGNSILGKETDKIADKLVKKFAHLNGWSPRLGKEDNISSAIGFLERKFKVNYDQRNGADVDWKFRLSPSNHHFKSLSHSPDILGLFFSILDQFMNTSSFFANGKLVRIDTSSQEFRLKGSDFKSKLYAGFCNWIGHIISDMAGSSGGRGQGGRGMGVPIPFMNMFQLCDFGSFYIGDDKTNLANVMVRVYEEGYDLRHGGAMAVPVVLEELMIRTIWVIRRRFLKKYPWEACTPSMKNADLRIMLIVGNSTLCLLDGTDAVVNSVVKGGNIVSFISRLNLVAWTRLLWLVLAEVQRRVGPVIAEEVKRLENRILYYETAAEKAAIAEFENRLRSLTWSYDKAYREFVYEIESKNELFYEDLNRLCQSKDAAEKCENSWELASGAGVDQSKIFRNERDLDKHMRG